MRIGISAAQGAGLCPNDVQFTEQDKRIYEREQVRLRLSLDAAMRDGAEKSY